MRALKILLIIVLLLGAIRIALPYAVLKYAEHRINQIPGYYAKISDLDMHIYRGSYTIKGLRLLKTDKKIPVPFFAADSIELAVQWRALLHGSFVAKITVNRPELNLVTDPAGTNEQLSISDQWLNVVKSLFPLNFNHVTIHQGALHFRSFTSQPPFNVFLKNIEAELDNLQNIKNSPTALPSVLTVQANTMDGAVLKMTMHFNPFAKQPMFNLDVAMQRMNIKAANNLLRHYTKVDVQQGWFSLYVEAAAAHGKITGYAKPFLQNLQILPEDKSSLTPVEAIYKGALQLAAKVLENPRQKTVATRIVIKGNLENPDTSLWSIVGNLLSHAFLQALLPQIDNSIDVRDIEVNG